jgi:hypothetical protein
MLKVVKKFKQNHDKKRESTKYPIDSEAKRKKNEELIKSYVLECRNIRCGMSYEIQNNKKIFKIDLNSQFSKLL